MSNSRARINKDVIFSQVLNYADDINYSGGVLTGILAYENGTAYFGGSSYITYPRSIPGIKSIRLSGLNFASVVSQELLYLNASQSISIVNGVVTTTGISSPTIYVDGVQTTAFTTTNSEIIVTTATNITATLPKLGTITTPITGYVGLCTMMVRQLSVYEASNLFYGRYYTEPDTTGLLLDFDARQSTPKDNTGRNTLVYTPGNGGQKRMGINYAYKFDNASTKIDCGRDLFSTNFDRTISLWLNPMGIGELATGGYLLTNGKFRIRLNSVSSRYVITNDAEVTNSFSNNNTLVFGIWLNLICTINTIGESNIYLNGSQTGVPNKSIGNWTAGTHNLLIGNNNSNVATINGYIARVKIWDRILALDKISQEFTSQKSQYGL